VDLESSDGVVNRLSRDTGAREECQIGTRPGDGPGPSRSLKYFSGVMTVPTSVQTLTVKPPCAQFVFIHNRIRILKGTESREDSASGLCLEW